MAYLTGKFRAAVADLVGNGPIKQRLTSAYLNHLDDIHEDEVGPEERWQFVDLRRRLYHIAPASGEGPVRASVRKMSPVEAAECAELILSLFDATMQREANGHQLHLVDGESAEKAPVPRFLIKS